MLLDYALIFPLFGREIGNGAYDSYSIPLLNQVKADL